MAKITEKSLTATFISNYAVLPIVKRHMRVTMALHAVLIIRVRSVNGLWRAALTV